MKIILTRFDKRIPNWLSSEQRWFGSDENPFRSEEWWFGSQLNFAAPNYSLPRNIKLSDSFRLKWPQPAFINILCVACFVFSFSQYFLLLYRQ
jgi:hypothetical protein